MLARRLFGQAQLLTGGGPSGSSRTVVLFIFEAAFGRWELGYASAAAEVSFAIEANASLSPARGALSATPARAAVERALRSPGTSRAAADERHGHA